MLQLCRIRLDLFPGEIPLFKRVAIKQNNLVSFLQIIIRMGFGSIGERAGETASLYFHHRMKCL